jgi:hypothetical protein
MIDVDNTGILHELKGMCSKWDLNTYIPIIPPADVTNDLNLCCINQLVLADTSAIIYQNDVNSFMYNVGASSCTLTMYLQKNNITIATLNSSTYGTYYAKGSIVYYTDQSLLTGYVVEWSKVLALHGEGSYRIKFDYVAFGTTTTFYSNLFNLRTYSTARALGTIRIDSYMDGYMMRDNINYKGLNFPDMVRVRGWFGSAEEKYEITNDIYSTYNKEKRVVVQRKVNQYDIYDLETHPLPKCIADKIRYYHFFGNTVYLNDYNIFNYDDQLKQIRVYKGEAFDFKYTKTTKGIMISGKLTEQIQDLQKTNC